MKKTSDGRFIEKRVLIQQKDILKIMSDCKKIKNWTWHSFASYFGVSESTLKDWLNKGGTLPLPIFKKLIKISPHIKWNDIKPKIKILEPFWGQKIGKILKPIKMNINNKTKEKYAEFYGAMLGDGCVFSNLFSVCITCNSILDKNYVETYLSSIIKILFGIEPRIYYSKDSKTIRCLIHRKSICEFFIREGFPRGKKKKNAEIPVKFFKDTNLLKACIRGIMDTDGSIYPQRNKVVIDISIKSPSLLKSVISAFNTLKIDFGYTKNRVYIHKPEWIKEYFNKIGSSNLRHILKYKIFLKTGKMPKSDEIETFLKKNNVPDVGLPNYEPIVQWLTSKGI